MKITAVTLSKTIKQTRASRDQNGLTHYNSIEPSMSMTIEATEEGEVGTQAIHDVWETINHELVNELDTEPRWLRGKDEWDDKKKEKEGESK